MKIEIEVISDYWLGEYYSHEGWQRLTLFHKKTNSQGGAVNTPIATIDIVKHPGQDCCNPHSEIRFKIRNEVMRKGNSVIVDHSGNILRHATDVVDYQVLNNAVEKIKQKELATLPLSIYVCMEHVEKFETQGDFWTEN